MALTNNDLDNIKELFNQVIEDKTQDLLVTKDDIKHLPTKDEFYVQEDKLMKRLDNIEQEMEILNGLHGKVNSHEERLDKVEKKLGLQI